MGTGGWGCRGVGVCREADKLPTTATLLRDGRCQLYIALCVSLSENWMENPGANFVVDPVPYRAVLYNCLEAWRGGEHFDVFETPHPVSSN